MPTPPSLGTRAMIPMTLAWTLIFVLLLIAFRLIIPTSTVQYATAQAAPSVSSTPELLMVTTPVIIFLSCWWWLSRPSTKGEDKILEHAQLSSRMEDRPTESMGNTPEDFLAEAESLHGMGSNSLAAFYRSVKEKQDWLVSEMQKMREQQYVFLLSLTRRISTIPHSLEKAHAQNTRRATDELDKYEEALSKLREAKQKFERLETMRQQVYDRWHHKRIEEKSRALLGGSNELKAFEWFILFLIVIVLAVLLLEEFMPRRGNQEVRIWFLYIDAAACVFFLFDFGAPGAIGEDPTGAAHSSVGWARIASF